MISQLSGLEVEVARTRRVCTIEAMTDTKHRATSLQQQGYLFNPPLSPPPPGGPSPSAALFPRPAGEYMKSCLV